MGASVKSAYEFLVSMGVITYFIPYALMFAALLKAQGEPLPPGARRGPGGVIAAITMACLGLVTIAVSIFLALFPPGGGSAATIKVIAATVLVVGLGTGLYVRARGKRFAQPLR